jgi:hypothetical protein
VHRFHGMEEVKGSNPFRSTKIFQTLSFPSLAKNIVTESNWSPKMDSAAIAARLAHSFNFEVIGPLYTYRNPTFPTFCI